MKTLRQLFGRHVAQTSPSPLAIEVERAEGVFLYTPQGKRYFDLISGVSVSNVGHGNRAVVEAVCAQAREYMHTMVYGETIQAPQVRYAARLASLLPPELQSVYFVNSGAEAVEGALKLAKMATGRRQTIAFRRAYHGSTHGALSMMSSPEGDSWRVPFEPLLPDVEWLDFNDFEGLAMISERTACVLAEPIQGEAGVRLPTTGAETCKGRGSDDAEGEGFMSALRRRCDEVGALLIFDEVQTGMGRTGPLFAFERAGGDTAVVPDILCLAKALGGGMPLGAFVSSHERMGLLSQGAALGHITTFGGHPVCCAAGLAALEYILDEGLLQQVERKGALFERLLSPHPCIAQVRRAGLLAALELTGDETDGKASGEAGGGKSETATGAAAKLMRLMELFARRGIMSDWFLFCDTAFRISPPLTITEDEIRECCGVILDCLDEVNTQ